MKKITFLVLLLIATVSCSNDDNDNNKEIYFGKWTLTFMSRNNSPLANSIPVIEWQETYNFSSKGKFAKTRTKDGKTKTVVGTYSVNKVEDRIELKLKYTAQNDIIGTCSSDLTENLFILNNTGTLYNGWSLCKGPQIAYEKI
ncbi:hypothetical protein K6T82_10565 [Flavobacterium sp. 17A]|uniref:Lipocalin-like domain-containing protein n=1 Tax=Flavobacterium potami TaxID=2872310 RepID=A0A9X1KQN5_9FLAO|nr:hypothetical protein [Flavobacterium potami]MBZ4035212.1 hypothetical protein [Flavobacterium potami]